MNQGTLVFLCHCHHGYPTVSGLLHHKKSAHPEEIEISTTPDGQSRIELKKHVQVMEMRMMGERTKRRAGRPANEPPGKLLKLDWKLSPECVTSVQLEKMGGRTNALRFQGRGRILSTSSTTAMTGNNGHTEMKENDEDSFSTKTKEDSSSMLELTDADFESPEPESGNKTIGTEGFKIHRKSLTKCIITRDMRRESYPPDATSDKKTKTNTPKIKMSNRTRDIYKSEIINRLSNVKDVDVFLKLAALAKGVVTTEDADGSTSVKAHICILCRQRFEKPEELYRHLRSVHPMVKTVVPEKCYSYS